MERRRGINDAGKVILWGDTTGGKNHAGLWDAGQIIDLGTLGGEDSWAYGLNNAGTVVGWAELPSGIYHATAWIDGTIADLGTLGGLFSSAYAVNDAGVIVGTAQDAMGQWQAVRWIPIPEPTAALLLSLGGLALLKRRR